MHTRITLTTRKRADSNFTVVIGHPAGEIVRYVKEQAIDLIVIPAQDDTEGVFSHFLFGSVAEQLVRHAPCPVLVMR
ncbi:universal stress protein [Phormidesmis sp. 146-33]